jgi:hypothetical protein
MATSGLSAAELLELVDAGVDGNAAQRGAIMLAAAAPDEAGALERLSLGQRDAWVLALRCATFGDTLLSRVACPHCGMLLTVRIPRGHVSLQEPATGVGPVAVEHGEQGLAVEARAPDGDALAQAAACPDVAAARAALIGCCVTATRDGEPIDPLSLDAALLERLGEAIVATEPQVEVRVSMRCASCDREWAPVLDIVQFFWRELSAASVQLLDEVHQLAIGYGWSEEQVLKVSSRRRRQYVERLASG